MIPDYDNVLGVFTLLETPEILVETSPSDDDADGDYIPYYQDVADISLSSPLKYAINPASGLSIKDFAVSFVVEGCEDYSNGATSRLHTSETGLTSPGVISVIPTSDPPSVQPAAYISPAIPLDCVSEYSARLHRRGSINCVSSVKLRLSLTLGRSEDDPFVGDAIDDDFIQISFETNEVIATYNEPRPSPNSFFSNLPIEQKVENLSLTDDLTLYAWTSIEVGNGIQTNGHQLTMIAGREIIVPPDVFVPANVDLIIGLPPACAPVPPQTEEEICEFCNTKYDPAAALSSNEPTPEAGNCLKIWPNPVAEQVQVASAVKEMATDVRLQLYSNLGQRIST